jgi:hypothetical protein
MATLVLTAVGTAIGGPIGGAIGALIGQAADATIFRPGGREAPRLSDLRVQTSTYGARIPRLHGAMRVAGTVIWSTDLVERGQTSGGGKGQPSVTSYSYSASFAVALSSRPIRAIGRIWAEGNLLRGAGGDFKSPLGAMRLHRGERGQAPDPLIVAALGEGQASAHRDMAYVVLEDLDLADFGNRIPTLTFEVFADDGEGVEIADIAASAIGAPVTIKASPPLRRIRGFACDGQDVRSALRPLLETFDLRYRETSGGELTLVREGALCTVFASGEQIARSDEERVAPFQLSRRALEDVPTRLALRYYDPARDYQAGIQSAERPGTGRTALTVDLPATLDAGTARALADDRMRAALRGRLGLTVSLGWTALDRRIGGCIAIENAPGLWRIERIEWSGMVVRLSLSQASNGTPLGEGTGAPGIAVPSPDREIGVTSLVLVELPADPDGTGDKPAVFAAATGAGEGWRGAALYRMDGGNARPIGTVSQRAIIGTALDALPSGSATTLDTISTLVVSLARPGDMLRSVDDAALRDGENLCMIGHELLQFGSAEPAGAGRFRISRLTRGLQGTEWSMSDHEPSEPFVLVDTSRFVRVDLSGSARGYPLDLRAIGVGDVVPATASLGVSGAAMTAPAPVHGTLRELSDGGLAISWVRRSRAGWRWLDGTDVPLGEEAEAYRIVIEASATALRTATVAEPMWTYSAAERSADLALGLPTPVARVTQIGTWGEGRPLIIPL